METETIPYLLAGPMVRRVEAQHVCVWVATKEPSTLRLQLRQQGKLLETQVIDTPIIQLGEGAHCWVYLLRVKPADPELSFPLDQIIHYEIHQTDQQKNLDLSDVCFQHERAPSFIISSQLRVIAYGSCRKPHGRSKSDSDDIQILQKSDSLALLGDQLEADLHDIEQRPSILCLLGDQIYADDVLQVLMGLLQDNIKKLFTYEIDLNGQKQFHTLSKARRLELQNSASLSSTSGHQHLLSFAEYSAMYLFVFGNRSELSLKHLVDTNPSEKQQSLNDFIASLPQIRKLLANIASYMIFDDHDVSDDWNITRLWHDKVQGNAKGRRIVSNALAAYWVFQGWGNDPDRFSQRFIKEVSGHLQAPEDKQKAQLFDSSLWKMHRWHYSIPSNPPILVLDTRTQRDFGGYNNPPQLLNYAATEKLQADILRLQHKNAIKTAPLIISATPVMGHTTIERTKKFIYRIGLIFGKRFSNSLDLESWFANKQGAARLLDILSKMKLPNNEVVFLSGDVHYSFVHKAHYYTSDSSEVLNCYQLTSSALRNAPKQRCCVSRLSKFILNSNRHTTHKKPKQPENLPWWAQALLWRLFQRSYWTVDIETIDGIDKHNKRIGRTTRSNIAILYLLDGKIQKQVLLSGDQRRDSVHYDFKA